MLEYKFVYKGDIVAEYLAGKKDTKRIDPLKVSVPEQIQAMIAKFQELGKEGWRYVESFNDFGAYLFAKNGKKKWKYNLVSISKMEMNAKTKTEQADSILKGLNELGKDGWIYVTIIYFESPVPRLEALLVKETSGSDKDSDNKISDLEAKVKDRDNEISELEKMIKDLEKKIKKLEK